MNIYEQIRARYIQSIFGFDKCFVKYKYERYDVKVDSPRPKFVGLLTPLHDRDSFTR